VGGAPFKGKQENIEGSEKAEVWLTDGIALYQVEKYEEALMCIKKALELSPDHYEWHFLVSGFLKKLGKQREREEYLKKPEVIEGVRKKLKDLASEYSNEGDALAKLGNQGAAREYYAMSDRCKGAIKNPEIAIVSLSETLEENVLRSISDGSFDVEEKKEEKWVRDISQCVSLTQVGKYEEAIICYKKALEIHPDKAEIHFLISDLLKKLGKEKEGFEYIQRTPEAMEYATEGLKKKAVDIANRGNALADLGKYDEAIENYDRALAIAPENPIILLNKAISLRGKGVGLAESKRPNDALECFEKAIAIKPDYSDGWNAKGAALSELGEYDQALMSFEKALTIDPTLATAWYGKGSVLELSGKIDEAIRCYERCLSIEPNADYSDYVRERLKNISQKSKKGGIFR
jgi:tetratricopeptide (TPR) repeat protein